jgi:uncharacterized protein YegP (UPF0339 family)
MRKGLPKTGTASRPFNKKEGNTMTGKFEIYRDKSGKYRWRLTHVNGLVIAKSGKSHNTKVNAMKDIWGSLAAANSS